MTTTPDLSRAQWIKSSHSNGNGGNCIEFTRSTLATGTVPVRDSKNPHGPALTFPTTAWQEFIDAVTDGEFGTV